MIVARAQKALDLYFDAATEYIIIIKIICSIILFLRGPGDHYGTTYVPQYLDSRYQH